MMQLGNWADLEVSGLQLSMREELEMIESYIPQYFEDDAPLGIMLSGAFMYTPGPDSDFNRLCRTTVGEIRDRNRKCRECKYVDRCTGSCRNSALLEGDDYYAPSEENCYFFENGWEERITAAAEGPFADYIRRCPPQG